MDFWAKSGEDALEICLELARSGRADIFRGQTRDWPILAPSAFRLDKAKKRKASEQLESFLRWASSVPQMASYFGNQEKLTAIAQHYGIPTNYLDLTRDPETALLFSKAETLDSSEENTSVIYCFKRSSLELLQYCKIVEFNVHNLWRLEIQHGLFLNFKNRYSSEELAKNIIKVKYPSEIISKQNQLLLYPIRKSALETVIDQWLYRYKLDDILTTSLVNTKKSLAIRRQTYPGAFKWRNQPELNPDWFSGDGDWIFPPVESVSISYMPTRVHIKMGVSFDYSTGFQKIKRLIKSPIITSIAENSLINFTVELSEINKALENPARILINRIWDGIRILPYSADELINCISSCIILLIGRAEKLIGEAGWIEGVFGEAIIIEFAPMGGHIESGLVSKDTFLSAITNKPSDQFTEFMKRKVVDDPEYAMLFVVDHWLIFEFEKFKTMFVEQLIPSAVDSYFAEDLKLYDGQLGCMWSISFNPIMLGYVTTGRYRFGSPIGVDHHCAKIIYVSPEMQKADLEELFAYCLPHVLQFGEPFQVKFDEYGRDEREIWQIQRVAEQCKWIIDFGGISVLDVIPQIKSYYPEDISKEIGGLGAYDIWTMSKGLINSNGEQSFTKHLFEEFKEELIASNKRLEMLASILLG